MKVSELGEFRLINLLAKIAYRIRDKQTPAWQNLLIGIGDDAAAWRGDASTQLLTVDSFIQDEHFSLAMTSWQEAGWKALAVNLSDIAAMGGVPQYAVVSPFDAVVKVVRTQANEVSSQYTVAGKITSIQ